MTSDKLVVLVINDDGAASPLLIPFLDEISAQSWCGELRVVVPATEQSWVAQCITRFRELEATPHLFGKHRGFFVNGTAADCSTLGIHNLYENKPDLVLSGVNMGWNSALPFFMSSGTIGAAAEAFLTKVPALALSAYLPDEVYRAYSGHDAAALQTYFSHWPLFAKVAVLTCAKLLAAKFWNEADILSVNLPWDVSVDSASSITSLTEAHFEKLFIETEKHHFRHKMQPVVFESPRRVPKPQTASPQYQGDIQALERGIISITPIRFGFETSVSKSFISQIEGT